MARKIYITPEDVGALIGTATAVDNRKATLLLSVAAWAKIQALVSKYTTEVQWHGTVERVDATTFLVKDIILFPHTVTGATVTSDQDDYEEWINFLPDNIFNQMRFHGHSHVNMAVSPSEVDMKYRRDIIRNFGSKRSKNRDDFYIFLIINKSGCVSAQIYDLKNNSLYTKDDLHTEIVLDVVFGDGSRISDFLEEAASVVKTPAPIPSTSPTAAPLSKGKGGSKPQEKKDRHPVNGYGIKDYDGYDYSYGYKHYSGRYEE